MEEMSGTQSSSEKRFIFGGTKYWTRKMVIITGEIGGKKVKIKTEVMKGRGRFLG